MTWLRLRRPEEGWLPLVMLLFMVLTVAWAIDDPGWVNGKEALTDNLPLFAVLGLAVGFVGPKVGWGRWTTHLVGAAFAGLLIPVFAGWAVHPEATIAEAFTATASGSINAYLDIAWRGRPFTSEEIHYILTLGILVWGTAQFAGYAVFGHRRPISAVAVAAVPLILNMALTRRDQVPHLVAFTACALLLLIAMHAFDERTTWIRRRIGDPAMISSLYLRGGTVFIVIAMFASLVLSTRAASSPLAGAWAGINDQLVSFGQSISRLFPTGGDFIGTGGVRFDNLARISSQWTSDGSTAFTATVPPNAVGEKWRAATYDKFLLDGWEQTEVTSQPVPADENLLVGTPEDPAPDLTLEVQVQVRSDSYHDTLLLSPGTPTSVDRDAAVLFSGPEWSFGGVDVRGDRSSYQVTARILNMADTDVISGHRLEVASTDYPADISARYTDVPAGAMGPDAQALLATIIQTYDPQNPYDLAVAIERYLKDDSHFHYSIDLRQVSCDSSSKVECFARTRQGYCLHYASTMAILLRAANPSNPIPTRLVQGFLPSDPVGTTETVPNKNAHAWVEVYFPGYGWIPFDPTGGGVGQPSVIQEGPQVASPTPAPGATDDRELPPTRRPFGLPGDQGPQGPVSINAPGDSSLLIVLTGVLGLLVAAVAFVAWMRGPRGEINPDSAWQSLSRGAARLGFAPRPTQTIYEYAASLAELVPVARPDLQTIADAKVESAYARVRLGGDRLRAVNDALRRLRLSLLRLLLRRGRSRWRRRS